MQGQAILETHNLHTFRQLCFQNRPDSVMEISSGTLSQINVCEHSSLRRPQMQVKAFSCKVESHMGTFGFKILISLLHIF